MPAGPQVEVLAMGPEHLEGVTRLHLRALPEGFFARLGAGFLRAYLSTYRASPYACAFAAVGDGRLQGFLVGVHAPAAHRQWVIRHHGLRLALRGAVALLARPRLLALFVRTRLARYGRALLRRRGSPAAAAPAGASAAAVLAHVAVDREARGAGAGRALVDAFLSAVAANGGRAVVLVTRAGSGAEAFYDRLGFERSSERTDAEGVVWVGYRVELP